MLNAKKLEVLLKHHIEEGNELIAELDLLLKTSKQTK